MTNTFSLINDQNGFDFQTKIQSTHIVTDQKCCEIWNLKDLEFRYMNYTSMSSMYICYNL